MQFDVQGEAHTMGSVRSLIGAAFVVSAASFAFAGDGDARVVVGFKGDADQGVLAKHGVGKAHLHGKTAVAKMSAAKAAQLRADPSVSYVEEDGVAEAVGKKKRPTPAPTQPAQPSQVTPDGITKVWGGSAPATTGAGVKVAVIDTGIDYYHPDLSANVAGNVSFVSGTSSGLDDNGHGTHVAGTIASAQNTIGVVGVAPGAALYAVKVLDSRGSGWNSDVAEGIDWAADHGINVVNMSLGSSVSDWTLENACNDASNRGVLLVCAAGNSGDGNTSTIELGYPAAFATCVAVGAVDSTDALAWFSNTGSFVDVCAPGVNVYSTYKGGTYAWMSGTSMATPHAAGVAALIWGSTDSPTNASVRTALESRVRDLGPAGTDSGFGAGCVDFSVQ
jgi:subtilisin